MHCVWRDDMLHRPNRTKFIKWRRFRIYWGMNPQVPSSELNGGRPQREFEVHPENVKAMVVIKGKDTWTMFLEPCFHFRTSFVKGRRRTFSRKGRQSLFPKGARMSLLRIIFAHESEKKEGGRVGCQF